jgi:hypothetical protein
MLTKLELLLQGTTAAIAFAALLSTGITPAMAEAKPGTGSAYAISFRGAKGDYLDGGKTYKVTCTEHPADYDR